MNKKIFIAGATGFLGIRVCKEFSNKGYTVYALARQSSDTTTIEPYVSEFIYGDILKNEDSQKIYNELKNKNIPYLISLVGSVDYHDTYAKSRTINVSTTVEIAAIALKLAKYKILKKMIYTGSVASRGYYNKIPQYNNAIDENTDLFNKGLSVYCDVKRESEDYISAVIKDNNLPAVIVEPGSLVGSEIGSTSTTSIGLIKKIMKGIPILRGGMSYTSVSKVAEGFVKALEKGKNGETYLLGGRNLTMKEFALLVRNIISDHFPNIKSPVLPLLTIPKAAASLLGLLNIIINRQQALLGSTFHYINSAKAEKELGYSHSADDLKEEIINVLGTIIADKK